MKVFNLRCQHGHLFEGWFKSHLAYQDQQSRGLLECPLCESRVVEKMLSAPRLNLTGPQPAEPPAPSAPKSQATVVSPASVTPALAAALQIVREMLATSEDVGERFADEARAIHANEAPVRAIHGQTSFETAQELSEEGIPVIALPYPGILKTPLQ